MMNMTGPVSHTALDFNGLAELRRSSNETENDQETMRQVAGQFEALFINMMLQSMRKASLAEGVFDSSQSNMYRDMADQQMAMDLSKRGGLGLQEVIIRQLGGQLAEKLDLDKNLERTQAYSMNTVSRRSALPIVDTPAVINQLDAITAKADSVIDTVKPQPEKFKSPSDFVKQLWSMAETAAQKIGVEPAAILSQAALETGWGKHILAGEKTKSSYNLFNIKASSGWSGDTVSIGTLEYRNGVAVKEQAQFRVYDSYQDSFNDYIEFLQTQPRYRQALESASDPALFIEGLHKAGYATDPAYADKIKRIMNSDTLTQISSPLDIASNVAENMTTGIRS